LFSKFVHISVRCVISDIALCSVGARFLHLYEPAS